MEKEILLLKEEVLALRQQIERLNKKLEDLNLNPERIETVVAEGKGVTIVDPAIIVYPMQHPDAEKIIELALNKKVKTLKSTERYGHTTNGKIKPNSRFKK